MWIQQGLPREMAPLKTSRCDRWGETRTLDSGVVMVNTISVMMYRSNVQILPVQQKYFMLKN